MKGAQFRQNIYHFICGQNLSGTKRAYLLNKSQNMTFRKIVTLEKLLLCEMSSCTVNEMRSPQTLQNINLFIGGHNLFLTKRTYLLNKGEKMPFHKMVIIIVIIVILLHIFLWHKNFTASRKSLDNTFRKIVLLAKLLLCKMSFTILDKTVEKIAFVGVIFSKLRSRPILPSPSPPGSNVVGSSKESRILMHL